jgi:hypothetical protein
MTKAIFVSIPRNASGTIERACEELDGFEYFNENPSSMSRGHLEQRSWYRAKQLFPDSWAAAKKFGVIRNPWSRVVSMFHHKTLVNPAWSFGEFIKLIPALCAARIKQSNPQGDQRHHPDKYHIQHHVLPQVLHFYDENHQCVLDCLLRFENLQGDFDHFLDTLGLKPAKLVHYNFSGPNAPQGKSTSKKYVEFYTESWMIDYVGKIYVEDVKFGNYKFGQEYQK